MRAKTVDVFVERMAEFQERNGRSPSVFHASREDERGLRRWLIAALKADEKTLKDLDMRICGVRVQFDPDREWSYFE